MRNGLDGLKEVLENLNKEIEGIENRGMDGLFAAGLMIQRAAQQKTPVDSGNLRGSAYTRKEMTGGKSVEVGFTAMYALAVHEMVGQRLKGQARQDFGSTADGAAFGAGTGKGSYWDSGQPKFLEAALNENRRAIVDEIRRRARLKA
jgi:hypothetical protein